MPQGDAELVASTNGVGGPRAWGKAVSSQEINPDFEMQVLARHCAPPQTVQKTGMSHDQVISIAYCRLGDGKA